VFLKNLLLKFLIPFLLFLLSNQTGIAQKPVKLISTLNSGGSSNNVTVNSRDLYYQQSIGQSGIIGLSGGKNQLVRQGFIQPMAGPGDRDLTEFLPAEIYPNPFLNQLTITFPEDIPDKLYVTIYDLNGKIVFLKKYEAARELKIDVSKLAPSIYILRVNTTTRSSYSKVVKLHN
jgi:hypothetical protein